MIVLDTNVVSELMKPHPDAHVREWLKRTGDAVLTTTAVTVAEISYGLQRLPEGRRRDQLQSAFDRLTTAVNVLPLDEGAAAQAGKYRARRDTSGLPSTASDMMIAGITAAAGATLATRNTKDFEGLPLRLCDPWLAN